MQTRYGVNPNDFKTYQTEDIRKEFLIENLFIPDTISSTYTHIDRMVTMGCMPVNEAVSLEKDIDVWKTFGVNYFLERREIGIFNVGGDGIIIADDTPFEMGYTDCLYLSKGTKSVLFKTKNPKQPAKFYMVSAPAHKVCKTTFISMQDAAKRACGASETANDRIINQFIHPDVLETCQLSMGLTQLKSGSVWNTMPAHTHERRMEIYFYFEVPENQAVFHFMGQAQETRHLVLLNEQAVISPSWSIHCGAGTSNYCFIWAMAGENMAFDDMDSVDIPKMR